MDGWCLFIAMENLWDTMDRQFIGQLVGYIYIYIYDDDI
jgi:hypothetical protein